jgi:hypothetical protein
MEISKLKILSLVVILFISAIFIGLTSQSTNENISLSEQPTITSESEQTRPSNVSGDSSGVEPPERDVASSSSASQDKQEYQSYVVIVDGAASNYSTVLADHGELGTTIDNRAEMVMDPANTSKVQSFQWVISVRRNSQAVRPDLNIADNIRDITNISTLEAEKIHKKGITADGVKIGVIGNGAKVTDVSYEDQISGIRNFKNNQAIDANPKHDTAAVEQVSEIAPGAELYITGVESQTDFGAAIGYLIDQDVDIILTELAYYGVPSDGSSYIAQKTDEATSDGLTVVTPAGNSRLSHYESQFNDPDNDGIHNFAGEDELNRLGGSNMEVVGNERQLTFFLTWSDFDSESVSDYDFYLRNDETGEFVAKSERSQIDGASPAEVLSYSTDEYEPLSLVVNHYAGDTDDQIEIYGPDWGYSNQYHTPGGSVVPPATASTAVSTAAYNTPEQQIARYSAEGPVEDRPGITIAGYSHLPASPYDNLFTGTSGAGPYVTGTAALVQDASGGMTPRKTRNTLQQTADPVSQPPERTGAGLVNATAAVNSVANLDGTDSIITDEVSSDGSVITIETDGKSSISITNIEGEISDISTNGAETDEGILFSSLGGLPETVSFTLTPPGGADTVNFDIDGETVELDVSNKNGDSRVLTEEVSPGGSAVTIETNGGASISITNIEGEVSDLSANGAETDEGVLFSSLGGLPETVSFRLVPPVGAETVSFDIDGETVQIAISTDRFSDREFNNEQYTAVFGTDGDQTQNELSSAINEWFTSENNSVNGVTLSQDDMSDLINYWFNNL